MACVVYAHSPRYAIIRDFELVGHIGATSVSGEASVRLNDSYDSETTITMFLLNEYYEKGAHKMKRNNLFSLITMLFVLSFVFSGCQNREDAKLLIQHPEEIAAVQLMVPSSGEKYTMKQTDHRSDVRDMIDYINQAKNEYYGAAKPPVRCGESHLSGLTEPPRFVY